MKANKQQLLLNEPNLYKTFLVLSFPVFLANLLTSVHDIVDSYFLGQIENSVYPQAAISLTWPLINMFIAFGTGLAVAGVSVMSQHLGAGKDKESREYAGVLFLTALVLGICISIIIYIIAPTIMVLMGTEGAVYENSVIYLRVRALEFPFVLIFSAFQAMRQAYGDTVTPFYISASTIILNIVLTAYMVKVLGWGIFGAGFATLLANAALCPVVLFLLFRRKATIRLTKDVLKFDREKFNLLFKIGIPSALGNCMSSFGFMVLNAMILSYGEVIVAAFSIGNKISNILLMPMSAISTVQATYIGQNIGANNSERVSKGFKTGCTLALALSITGAAVIMPVRGYFASLMSNNPDVVAVASEYMVFVLLLQPLMGLFQNYNGVFNGAGKTKFAMMISLSRLWVLRIPLILIFKHFTNFGRFGIWYAMVLSNFLILFMGQYFYRKLKFASLVNN